MDGFHVTVETVLVPAGVGTHQTVEVGAQALLLLLLLTLQSPSHLDRLLWYLQTCLSVLNGHLHTDWSTHGPR